MNRGKSMSHRDGNLGLQRSHTSILRIALWSVLLLGTAGANASSAAVVKLLNTGFDDATMTKLANDTEDPDYIIGLGGTGGRVGQVPLARSTPIPNTYVEDAVSPDSRWLVLFSDEGLQDFTVLQGTYIFEIQVDLSGFLPETAYIDDLRYAADNKLIEVRINDNLIFSQSNSFAEEFEDFHSLGDLGVGVFQAGVNTIRFNVSNQLTSSSPMALRLEGSVIASPVPSPSSGALAMIALMAAAPVVRRRVLLQRGMTTLDSPGPTA